VTVIEVPQRSQCTIFFPSGSLYAIVELANGRGGVCIADMELIETMAGALGQRKISLAHIAAL
jgi:hypothetical protein